MNDTNYRKDEAVAVEVVDSTTAGVNNKVKNNKSAKKAKKARRRRKRAATLIVATTLFVILLVYLGVGFYFTNHFYFNTKVNGVDASKATAAEVKANVEQLTKDYYLKLETKGGSFETINQSDVGMVVDIPIQVLNEYISKQNPFVWPVKIFDADSYVVDKLISVDDAKLDSKVNSLNCVTKIPNPATADAYIKRDGDKYIIVDEVYGDDVDKELIKTAIKNAMTNLESDVKLAEQGCYIEPKILATDKSLIDTCAALNNIMASDVTYTVGGTKVAITSDQKSSWIINKDGQVKLDEDAISKFVDDLCKKYDTYNKPKSFACGWDGHVVTCPAGTYGWKINPTEEKAQLLTDLASGKAVTRNPVYERKAAGWGANELGGTFIEVDITHQMVYAHVNGDIVFKGPVVTGSVAGNSQTVIGAFAIYSKQRDRWLNGPTWHDWVSYWMPFYTDYGIHDATWRDEFGGDIFYENGSHGCVNMPLYLAQLVFDTFPINTPVLCYYQ